MSTYFLDNDRALLSDCNCIELVSFFVEICHNYMDAYISRRCLLGLFFACLLARLCWPVQPTNHLDRKVITIVGFS